MSKSLQAVVSEIDEIIVEFGSYSQYTKAEILAEVIKSCLLSDDDNPNHINGIELFTKCDECLSKLQP